MRISIIVPTLNEQECIAETLRNLQQLEGEKEIIVVDGGSSDETKSLACAQGAQVLTSPPGRGVQLHAGTLEATGDVLWFVHADTTPPPHALNEIRNHLENPLIMGGNFGLVFDGRFASGETVDCYLPNASNPWPLLWGFRDLYPTRSVPPNWRVSCTRLIRRSRPSAPIAESRALRPLTMQDTYFVAAL